MSRESSLKLVLLSSSGFLLEGLRKILEGQRDIEIIFGITGLEEVEGCFANTRVDLLFVDNRAVSNHYQELLDTVNRISPHTKIIMFDADAEQEFEDHNVISIDKETDSSELIQILKAACFFPAVPSANLSSRKAKGSLLSKSEIKVLDLVSNGLSNKQVARKLSIREKTVKAHLTKIFDKLELRSRYQLIAYRSGRGNRKGIRKSFPAL